MPSHPLRIVFMGTPDFAVASLEALCRSSHHVIAVVTAPDRPAGRGQQLRQSAVKEAAARHGITVLQPEKLKDEAFLAALRRLDADLFVVVAFRMLPEVVWSMPPKGTINVHGSLLPAYRGAAPINRAIMNGEHLTGVTTFLLQQEIDTGHVLMQEELPIGPDETAGELHDRMMLLGASLLVRTVDALSAGELHAVPQDELSNHGRKITHAPKIFREDCRINWNRSVREVHDHVRGLSPYPAAWTDLSGKTLKIFRGRKESATSLPAQGTVETDGKQYLRFACADGWYYAEHVQLEGKKAMGVEEFLRGYASVRSEE